MQQYIDTWNGLHITDSMKIKMRNELHNNIDKIMPSLSSSTDPIRCRFYLGEGSVYNDSDYEYEFENEYEDEDEDFSEFRCRISCIINNNRYAESFDGKSIVSAWTGCIRSMMSNLSM